MINLIPNDVKQSRQYGRRNRTLRRWVIMCGLAITCLAAIAGGGYFFINNAEVSARALKQQTEKTIQNTEQSGAQSELTEFNGNLRTVTQILSKQVLFSRLIQQIGSVTPSGAVLSSISLSDTDNALSLDFRINTAALAATVQVNMEDPKNELFEKADIINVSCQRDTQTGDETCRVQLRALFRDNAKFLFLNSITEGQSR